MTATAKGRSKATSTRTRTTPVNGNSSHPVSPAAERPGVLSMPGFEPLRLSTTDPEPLDDRTMTLFTIDDREYSVPVEIPMSWALDYLHGVGSGSEIIMAQAIDRLLSQVLGEDGWAAFRAYPHLKPRHFTWVMNQVTTRALGQVEDAVPKAPGNA